MRKNNVKSLIIIAAVIFPTVLLVGCSKLPFGKKEQAVGSFQSSTVTVEKMVIQESVTVSGNIQPMQVRELGFSSDGKITEVSVAEGDYVTEGTLLAKIDASSDVYNIEEMEYELEEMRFLESPRKIALKEKNLESLKETLKNKIITAPFDGVVVEIKHEEGEINIAGSDGYLIKIIDDSSLKAEVVVDELDIARIEVGQKAIFSFDAISGETFIGRVAKIAHIGRLNENGLPVIDVELIIDDPDPRVLIPYSFKVEILTTAPAEYLTVPEQAVIWEDDKTFVNIMNKDSGQPPIKREVKIREWTDGKTIVLEGVNEGDSVMMNTMNGNLEGGLLWM